jgi:arginyl-tRNA synthetase
MRKTAENGIHSTLENINEATISNHIDVIKTLHQYEPTVKQAAESLNPSAIANYAFELAKEFNQFYHDYPILKETDLQLASFRLSLSIKVGETLKKCLYLLGIEVPHRM